MNILFLSNRPSKNSQAATVSEYLDALVRFSKHNVHEVSMLGTFPKHIDLKRYDAVVIHYSLSIGPMIRHYLGDDLIRRLGSYDGIKAVFLQDEYRAIQTYWTHIRELKIDLLFSCVPEGEITKVYPPEQLPGVTVVNVLTGYVPSTLTTMQVPELIHRKIDVGYRSRQPPFWIGALGWEKTKIATEFQKRCDGVGLCCDISVEEGDRLYGQNWTDFILSCRVLLGTESGASIIDFDGKLEKRVDEYVADNPCASFEDVSKLFLENFEGSLRLHQISPRCFEAAALRTPMVLFEGEYSGVLRPDLHYIPLKKDFSNFQDVVEKINDVDALQAIAERTFQDVALNPKWGYPFFVTIVDKALEKKFLEKGCEIVSNSYTKAEFSYALRSSLGYYVGRKLSLWLQSLLLGVPIARKLLFKLWFALPLSVQRIIRPITRLISR